VDLVQIVPEGELAAEEGALFRVLWPLCAPGLDDLAVVPVQGGRMVRLPVGSLVFLPEGAEKAATELLAGLKVQTGAPGPTDDEETAP